MNELIIKILCLCILFNGFLSVTLNSVYAAEVLTEDSRKETVMESLENYAGEILTKVIYITSFISVIKFIKVTVMVTKLIVEEIAEGVELLDGAPNMFLPRRRLGGMYQQGINIRR